MIFVTRTLRYVYSIPRRKIEDMYDIIYVFHDSCSLDIIKYDVMFISTLN